MMPQLGHGGHNWLVPQAIHVQSRPWWAAGATAPGP